MNNNILLLGVLVTLINLSFYIKMKSVNRYLILSSLLIVSIGSVYNSHWYKREGFEEQGTTQPPTTQPPTTQPPTTTQATGIIEPNEDSRITSFEAFTETKEIISKLNKTELNDFGNILSTIISNAKGSFDAHKDISIVIQVVTELKNNQLPETELQQDMEYKALRDYLANILVNYSEAKFQKMANIFDILFNIYPIEQKEEVLNKILFTVIKYDDYITQKNMNQALLNQQKNLLGSQKQEIENYRKQKELEMQELKRELSSINVEEGGSQRTIDSEQIQGTIGDISPKELVYNVGVPIQDYMSQIIRPQDWSKALRPPSCIRDSTQLKEPVALLTDGIPSGAFRYDGVGTILPKFAYTEEYNPQYY